MQHDELSKREKEIGTEGGHNEEEEVSGILTGAGRRFITRGRANH